MQYTQVIGLSRKQHARNVLYRNKTIQWFLYGNPNHFENLMGMMIKNMHEDLERKISNALFYGTSHPEMYKQD